MAFTPSVYQQGIYDFITKGQGNAVVSAVAGSGKTTTLLNALKLIPTNKTILFLAFNKSIAKELSDKVPNTPNIHVKTVHGFGFSSLRDYRVDVFAQKYIKILNDVFEFLRTENLDLIKSYKFSTDDMKSIYQMEVDWEGEKIEKQGYLRRVLQLCDLGRMNLIDMSDADKGLEQLNEIATKHSVELQNGECFRAWHLIKLGTSFIEKMDFTDMIYMPIALNVRVRQYDYVFIDECQDLNACQRTLMLGAIKPKTGRFIAVGDKHQCQPSETLVTLSNGKSKRIDEIKIGDRLVSYCAKKGKGFTGYHSNEKLSSKYNKFSAEVLDVAKHYYSGNLVSVRTESELHSKYTPNHRCIVKFKKDIDRHILYLMEKDGIFRIGIFPHFCLSGFGLSSRSRQEKCSKSWILKTYESKKDAYFDEQYYSYVFGIPQLRFVDNNTGIMNQKDLDTFWKRFEKDNLQQNAIMLLNHFNLFYDYPFWIKNSSAHNSRAGIVQVYACNIFEDIMLLATFNKKLKISNKPLKAVFESFKKQTETYKGYVYSLSVSKENNYVADNILTHNSIYGFAGSDADSFDKLTNLSETIKLPLSVSYRCGTDIIAEAQKIIPHIEAFEGANKGTVEYDKELSHIKDGDMVLCRQTYPLVRLCLLFLSQGKKARIMGSDIGASLIKNIEDTKRKREDWTLETMFNRLYADLEKVLQTIMRKEKLDESDAKETRTYDMAKEKISVIEMLAIGCDFPKDVVDKIKNIFNDESTGGILLSTVHKSKGLESDRVFIIHPELMPSKYAKMDWEIEQESNLKYVAYTRAKDLLAFIPKSKFDAWKDSENESKSAEVKTISESNWVGVVDTKEPLELEVVFMREITNHWGTNKVFRYELKDSVGNLFVKLGLISERFLDEGDEITIGSKVRFNAVVKEHQEFRGEKITFLSTLAKY